MVGCRHGLPLLEITEIFGLPLTATFQDLGESSNVAEAEASGTFTPFPNPIQHGQQLRWETPTAWILLDGAGRTVSSGQSNSLTILDNAPAGVYTLRTEDGKTARIVVQ